MPKPCTKVTIFRCQMGGLVCKAHFSKPSVARVNLSSPVLISHPTPSFFSTAHHCQYSFSSVRCLISILGVRSSKLFVSSVRYNLPSRPVYYKSHQVINLQHRLEEGCCNSPSGATGAVIHECIGPCTSTGAASRKHSMIPAHFHHMFPLASCT